MLGPYALGYFPKPDLLITAGFLCETSPKTIDLMHEVYDIPVYYFDACQDRELKEYPEATRRVAELAAKSRSRTKPENPGNIRVGDKGRDAGRSNER